MHVIIMDVLQQRNEDFITNAYNNLLEDNDTRPSGKKREGNKGDTTTSFNEEHIEAMKLKKQAKRDKKQRKAKERQELLASGSGSSKNTFLGKHKWLGGAIDPQTGKIYGIPAHSYQIICITPPSSKQSTSKNAEEVKRNLGTLNWIEGKGELGTLNRNGELKLSWKHWIGLSSEIEVGGGD